MTALLLGMLILVFGMSLSRLVSEYRSDYQPIASLFEAERSSGFNAIYRILTAPVAIVIFSIFLYTVGREDYISNIWQASVWYLIFQVTLIVVLARWRLVNKPKFLLFHAISIALSYWLYVSVLTEGVGKLLPDEANLRTDLWLVIVAFFYGIFKNVKEDNTTFVRRKENYVQRRSEFFRKQYSSILSKYDKTFQNVLLAIMIYEDFNRPKVVRLYERFRNTRTQGIMQVSGAKSDAESIRKTIKILEPIYKSIPKADPKEPWKYEGSLSGLFKVHNPLDPNYENEVKIVFDELQAR